MNLNLFIFIVSMPNWCTNSLKMIYERWKLAGLLMVCMRKYTAGYTSFMHCNHRSGHLKTEYTESLFLLSWKLAPRPRSKHEKQTANSAWETWTVASADGVRCARVRWEINFLSTFKTAPFFCVFPIYTSNFNIEYISWYYSVTCL
jgi:hypothetical protein